MNGNLSGKTTPKERVEFILFIGKNYYRVCLSVGCLLSTFSINYHWLVVDSLCPFARKGILRCFKISLKLDLQCTLLLCKFLQIKTATKKKSKTMLLQLLGPLFSYLFSTFTETNSIAEITLAVCKDSARIWISLNIVIRLTLSKTSNCFYVSVVQAF